MTFEVIYLYILFHFSLKKSKIIKIKIEKVRCEQDLNLCGKIPTDFKSVALTTRPSQLLLIIMNILKFQILTRRI